MRSIARPHVRRNKKKKNNDCIIVISSLFFFAVFSAVAKRSPSAIGCTFSIFSYHTTRAPRLRGANRCSVRSLPPGRVSSKSICLADAARRSARRRNTTRWKRAVWRSFRIRSSWTHCGGGGGPTRTKTAVFCNKTVIAFHADLQLCLQYICIYILWPSARRIINLCLHTIIIIVIINIVPNVYVFSLFLCFLSSFGYYFIRNYFAIIAKIKAIPKYSMKCTLIRRKNTVLNVKRHFIIVITIFTYLKNI